MDYLMFLFFVAGGVLATIAGCFLLKFGRPGRVRKVMVALHDLATWCWACFAIMWWQVVILGNGGVHTLHEYFPFPGLIYASMVFVIQTILGRGVWSMIEKREKSQS